MTFKILCVDKNGAVKIELQTTFKKLNLDIVNVKDEIEAIDVLDKEKDKFNALIWNISSPDFEDFVKIESIKDRENMKNVPLIIVSRFTDKKYVIKAIEAGATEFIARPFDGDTITEKLCRVLGQPLEGDINRALNEEDIHFYSFIDMLNIQIKLASRGNYSLSVMMSTIVELDSNNSNDTISNEIIGIINKVIRTKLRDTDMTFQYGTNNLIVLLPFADKTGALTVEKKIHEIFDTHTVIKQNNCGCSLISAFVTFPDDGKIKERLLQQLEDNLNKST